MFGELAVPQRNVGMSIRDAVLMQTLGLGQADPMDSALTEIIAAKSTVQRTEVAEHVAKLREAGVSEAEIAYVYTGRYVPSA